MNDTKLPASHRGVHLICGLVCGFLLMWVLFSGMGPVRVAGGYELDAFGQLPIQTSGRVKPLRSEAIATLRLLSGKGTVRVEHGQGGAVKLPALMWYTATLLNPASAEHMKVIRLDSPEVKGDLKLPIEEKLFSYGELRPHRSQIIARAQEANAKAARSQDRFDRAILQLANKLLTWENVAHALTREAVATHGWQAQSFAQDVEMYGRLMAELAAVRDRDGELTDEHQTAIALAQRFVDQLAAQERSVELPLIPPAPSAEPADGQAPAWRSPYAALLTVPLAELGTPPPLCVHLAAIQQAWLNQGPDGGKAFNDAVAAYGQAVWAVPAAGEQQWRVNLEGLFNRLDPFYRTIVVYLVVFLMLCIGWLRWGNVLRRYAWVLLSFGFLVHTAGLVMRMLITNRPPVSNLYDSTLFVGWVAVLLGLIGERLFRQGFALTAAAVVGALSLMKGFQIAMEGGDTMGALIAVLNTNFWLATHVVCITIGYGACFFAAFIGHIYIFRGLFTRNLDVPTARSLELMTYGTVCFALLFSVVGTILGGIWADQSWGRFWGWDPKENGALLICLWLILILHARLGGYMKQRGLMLASPPGMD